MIRVLLVLSLVTPSVAFAGPCDSLITACDTALGAKDNEIAGLKDALDKSRKQTDHSIDILSGSSEPSILGIAVPVTLGLALGVILGTALKH